MFELNDLKRPPVTVEYKPYDGIEDGEGLEMELNLDLMTIERMEETEAEFEKLFADLEKTKNGESATDKAGENDGGDEENSEKESRKQSGKPKIGMFYFEKNHIRFRARMLGGAPGDDDANKRYIRNWKMVNKGEAVPVCYETLARMEKTVLDALYDFVTGEASKPTKKSATPSVST